ncbi:response regulator transcription factor [Hansschlegelia zhihuaiae]|uniref:Response regulator transcription factor n=1 Tax=Hansschlegelia zhihuaiae TaxID=405005 RepID=A0A4Q0MI23_9HYPH|nr:response regulator transcription factor [Hansschlegelia zhihuaiae]RXF72679.1 response regulator transcription factor [Hansschlegelia zhihuaiae]
MIRQSSNSVRGAAPQKPIVAIVDDDEAIRESLRSLFRSVDLEVLTFASPADLLAKPLPPGAACIVLDVRLPGVSGLDFQDQLVRLEIRTPIIFMTGHGDIPMTVRAMKAGAIDFLAKPFRDQDMLDAVMSAIERDGRRRVEAAAQDGLKALLETLTPRERQVMAHVVAGLMNKQIAHALGVSEITVKIHRGNVMRKMCAKSLADLVRMAEALDLRRGREGAAQTSV